MGIIADSKALAVFCISAFTDGNGSIDPLRIIIANLGLMTKGDRILCHGLRTRADGNGISGTIVIVRLCIDRITDSDAAVMKGTAVLANDQGIFFRFVSKAYGYAVISALLV